MILDIHKCYFVYVTGCSEVGQENKKVRKQKNTLSTTKAFKKKRKKKRPRTRNRPRNKEKTITVLVFLYKLSPQENGAFF